MNLKSITPSSRAIIQEAIIVIGGAIVAALVVGQLPKLKDWINEKWGITPRL